MDKRIKLDRPSRYEVVIEHECPECRADLLPGDRYCGACGAHVYDGENDDDSY